MSRASNTKASCPARLNAMAVASPPTLPPIIRTRMEGLGVVGESGEFCSKTINTLVISGDAEANTDHVDERHSSGREGEVQKNNGRMQGLYMRRTNCKGGWKMYLLSEKQ